jgi:hypothetical protein
MLRPTVSRPVCRGIKHPSEAYDQIFKCQTFAGLLMWGALSDEITDLPFTITAGPRQRSDSWVRVPWDSWPYFRYSTHFQFTVTHSLVFSVFTSRILATDLSQSQCHFNSHVTSSWQSLLSLLPFPTAANFEDCTQFSSDYCSVLLYLLQSQFQFFNLISLAGAEAEASCLQPAGTLTPRIGPAGTHGHIFVQCSYICFCFFPFVDPPYW